MGYCNYCQRDINKTALIKCPDCNMLYCRKCFVDFKNECLSCYTKNIEIQQEEMILDENRRNAYFDY